MRLFLKQPFAALWRSENPFEKAFSIEGEVFREVKNRKTIRFELGGDAYFIKCHKGVGWFEILKNWIQGKRPVYGADNEFDAIKLLEKIGVHTMAARAFGSRGFNPASKESFLITRALTGMISLEDFCGTWKTTPPSSALKHQLIRELATVCGKMHRAGLNHRDCYLCHFLMTPGEFEQCGRIRLFVLDLHRAEIRDHVPLRYQIKDLAGIYFSSMDYGFTKLDVLRFIVRYQRYCKVSGNALLRIRKAAVRLYQKEYSRKANPPL